MHNIYIYIYIYIYKYINAIMLQSLFTSLNFDMLWYVVLIVLYGCSIRQEYLLRGAPINGARCRERREGKCNAVKILDNVPLKCLLVIFLHAMVQE